ncbi:related to Alkylphosphocholine resistance protein LEM3 [Saccharomycodes ludwigii]|uniref:Related to Alkylphosphocholine resistance protein LEM3 n=1 Tax=Saccharomycodes ludwigii TaxID=36035 RepID=A0A376B3J8_9ASCO|nr:hypothetical protein SCDLUD_004994 [Saccharomycodes ludwigii]KAH3898672.1 hypothetical protein SCDLUD_004994 [Saccharomycodes ludwigii]SSD59253.1 related to Alkylphosphocholine resistance protein LEM3 [Saccharomycodes ludwigii]
MKGNEKTKRNSLLGSNDNKKSIRSSSPTTKSGFNAANSVSATTNRAIENIALKGRALAEMFKINHESKAHGTLDDDDVDASEFEDDDVHVVKKIRRRRPKDTPFSQQRIPAFNAIWTPNIVSCLYIFFTFWFILFGGVLLTISRKVDEVIIYYEQCSTEAPTNSYGDIPNDYYSLYFYNNQSFNVTPQWKYIAPTDSDVVAGNGTEVGNCSIKFSIPYDMPHPVYINYLVENFYPNHRRYALSFSEDQLQGLNTTYDYVKTSHTINCKALPGTDEGKQYYPCGLIANAMFNDTFPMELSKTNDDFSNLEDESSGLDAYELTNKGISWSTDKKRYKKTQLNPDDIVPPPNWVNQYPDGYNETNLPDVSEWEEFQNWMRNPAFSKFSKLIRRNANNVDLSSGVYSINIGLNWPVTMYDGKKALYITHGSSIGGRNNFLGTVYTIVGLICFALALIVTVMRLFYGRRLGDTSLLSWKREELAKQQQEATMSRGDRPQHYLDL